MTVRCIALGSYETNCYSVTEGSSRVIIDPGCFSERLFELATEDGLSPSAILLTHGHFDHICGAVPLARELKIPIYIGGEDADCLYSEQSSLVGYCPDYTQQLADGEISVLTLSDGDELAFDEIKIKALSLPGHTAGGRGYIIDERLFCGDTVFVHGAGRTDLPGGSRAALKASIEKILGLEDHLLLCPGHGESGMLGASRRFLTIYGKTL